MKEDIPTEVDLLVMGAGAGGMTVAMTGAAPGLDVPVIERTDRTVNVAELLQ